MELSQEPGAAAASALTEWRFAGYEAAAGAWQMAADSFLLRQIADHPEPIVVRLYRFTPPAISVGYHQDPSRVANLQACAEQGIDVVRRPTGGRALLHRNEINYSVVADTTRAPLFGRRMTEAFERISAGIASGLSRLGLEVEVSAGGRERGRCDGSRSHGLCASSTTRYEITCRDRKLAAAAQLRTGNNLLQHGMIYISETDPVPGGLFFRSGDRPGGRRRSRIMTNLLDSLGFSPSMEVLAQALEEGFSQVFGPKQIRRGFQPDERDQIARIIAGACGDPDIRQTFFPAAGNKLE